MQASGQPADSGKLDDEALVNAIFEAGFSTRTQSDALSGRGMGMNIVKRAVARMGGEIKIESQAGAFTRFKLTLPLAGAIKQGLLFKIGGQVYAVPAAHVIEVLPIGHNVLTSTAHASSSSTSGELPALGGVSVPILKLHALLGLELPPGRRAAALHVRYAGRNFLITCDKVIGPRTIVVRPPGPLIGLIPFYAGVTASGAGKAQLVLDLGALADVAYATSTPLPAAPRCALLAHLASRPRPCPRRRRQRLSTQEPPPPQPGRRRHRLSLGCSSAIFPSRNDSMQHNVR